MSSTKLEKRVAALEEEVARLKSRVDSTGASLAWWERIAGTFQKDPVYEKARKMGREYRESQRPDASDTGR